MVDKLHQPNFLYPETLEASGHEPISTPIPTRPDYAAEAAARLAKRIFHVRVERDFAAWRNVTVKVTTDSGSIVFEGPASKEVLRWFKRNQLVFFAYAEIFGKKNPFLKILRKDPDAEDTSNLPPPSINISDDDIPF